MATKPMPKTFTRGKNTYQVNKEGHAKDENGRLVGVWEASLGIMLAVPLTGQSSRVPAEIVKEVVVEISGNPFLLAREKTTDREVVRIQELYFKPDGKYERQDGKKAATREISGKLFGLGRNPTVMNVAELPDFIASLQRLR